MSNMWHSWFAWYPVWIIDGDDEYLVWWEHVVRRRVWVEDRYIWQYDFHRGGSFS